MIHFKFDPYWIRCNEFQRWISSRYKKAVKVAKASFDLEKDPKF